jgi:hypothetical protein
MLTCLIRSLGLPKPRSRAPRPAVRSRSCHVRGGYGKDHHVSALVGGVGRRPDTGRQTAADTSLARAPEHQAVWRAVVRKQRTVNPPIAPARSNFLYSSSRLACGRPPTAAVLGRTSQAARDYGSGQR